MSTFADDILEAVNGAPILCIVITNQSEYAFEKCDKRTLPKDKIGVPMTWEEARPLLDYDYNDGYGSQDCHDVNVWTADEVFYVHEYDGSTSIESQPRNPPPMKGETK